MAVLGICGAERCRVSWLVPQGFVNSSCWRWYRLVVRGGEPWVDRFGQAEAFGRGGCLACLRRCLPGYDEALRIGAIVAAQRCMAVLGGLRWRVVWVSYIWQESPFSYWPPAGAVASLGVSSEWLRGCLSFVILTAAQRL